MNNFLPLWKVAEDQREFTVRLFVGLRAIAQCQVPRPAYKSGIASQRFDFEIVETQLAAYVDDAERRAAHRERQIAAHIAASDAFVAKYGTLADEFGTL